MFDRFSLKLNSLDKKRKESIIQELKEKYRDYNDPWGFDINAVSKALDYILPLYRNYFKVRVFGSENVKDEPYMLVSNHTGQIPIDGVLITTAFAFDISPSRMVHSMIERFMANLPFLGDLTARTGSILGDRDNCKWLLSQGESILVFPEGVRGINKATMDFYKLQDFSLGFYRIALDTKTKILPITVVGAEEMFPFVFQLGDFGKKFGLPSLPISANLFPLPSPIDIYIGEPIDISQNLNPESTAREIKKEVSLIERSIKKQLKEGLEKRRLMVPSISKWVRRFKDVA